MYEEFITKDELHIIVSKNIKKYRIEKKMTQAQLSEKIGMSHDYFRQIESVKGQKAFAFYTLFKISKVLDVPLDKFIEQDPEEN